MIIRLIVCDLDVRYVEPAWRIWLKKFWYKQISVPFFYFKMRNQWLFPVSIKSLKEDWIDFKNNKDFFINRFFNPSKKNFRIVYGREGKKFYDLDIDDKAKGITWNGFKAYFDNSEGRMITSTNDIKELEKQGKMFMRPEEAKKIFAQKKKERDEEWRKEIRKSVEEKVVKMSQGFSYYNDLRAKGIIKE